MPATVYDRKIISITLGKVQEVCPKRYPDMVIKYDDNTEEKVRSNSIEIWEKYRDFLNPQDKKQIESEYQLSPHKGHFIFCSSKTKAQTNSNKVGLQIAFGFMAVVGSLAVALAFLLLKAALLNPVGLTVATVGGGVALAGACLFGNSLRKSNKSETLRTEALFRISM